MALSRMVASGICRAISVAPTSAATISPRSRIARNSEISPDPSDCAVKATVLMRRKVGQFAQPPEHVVAHMRQNQPLGVDRGQMRFQCLQAEMVLDDLVVVI